MPALHVCPLSRLDETLRRSGAGSVVSLLSPSAGVPRLSGIAPERHLHLALSDIVAETDGHVLPAERHVDRLLGFFHAWDRRAPLLIHCYAGVSRSTAAAFVALCCLDPHRGEGVHAAALRYASPSATPNAKMVALADAALGRDGRMIASIAGIGRGAECFEGDVFALAVNAVAAA